MSEALSPNIQANQNTMPAFVDNVASQFIVKPTGSPSTVGVSGFIFDIIGNEEIRLDSDITDSFLEDNTSIQDQIALRPEQFTLAGYVGELVNDFSNAFTDVITALQNFGTPPELGITLNVQDSQYYSALFNAANNAQNLINNSNNIYDVFSDISTTANKQQNAFQYFYNLWLSRTLCEVETPWGILQNMAILNVQAKQDETTRQTTDFSVSFKAMRFATTLTVNGTTARAAQVLATNPDTSGWTLGTPTDNSTLVQASANLAPSGGN